MLTVTTMRADFLGGLIVVAPDEPVWTGLRHNEFERPCKSTLSVSIQDVDMTKVWCPGPDLNWHDPVKNPRILSPASEKCISSFSQREFNSIHLVWSHSGLTLCAVLNRFAPLSGSYKHPIFISDFNKSPSSQTSAGRGLCG